MGNVRRLRLSAAGQTLWGEFVPRQEAWHAEQFGVLTDAEQRHLLALLRKLEHTL